MPLSPGAHLGPYEILGAIGAGGMGEVYRARDTRLDRDVAIKILPAGFAADAERLARFEREAKTLAALNHPNIAAIFGIEGSALVMELVDGDDLSQRIARGPIPLDEALPILRQIAGALEAAHEGGIVHRDLKPANIKVRADGTVKVLDFGLAKLSGPADVSPGTPNDLMNSPTITSPATELGMILGTASYMSPEQARGRAVDKRTDVWALGCVMFEMLTGGKAFDGGDATEIIAAVVKSEPDWSGMPSTVPPHVRDVVTRCLIKERTSRIPDVSVVRYLLDDANAPASSSARPHLTGAGTRLWKAAAVVCLVAAIAAGTAWYRGDAAPATAIRFEIDSPAGSMFTAGGILGVAVPAISPDGRMIAFTAQDASGKRQIWVRALDALTAQPLPGTDGAGYPFWSPDGRSIGYAVTGYLMRVDVAGGPPVTVCPLNPGILSRGGSWNRDGVIVFNNGPAPLYRVAAAGGDATPIGTLRQYEAGQQFPVFLPDGRRFLFSGAGSEGSGLYVGSLDEPGSTRLVAASSGGAYDAARQLLLFVRRGTLMAQRFDVGSLTVTGDAFPVAEQVEASVVRGITAFSVSSTGALVYGIESAGGAGHHLSWVDRNGTAAVEVVGPPARFRGIDLSPDGSRVAAHRHDRGVGGDIWVTDLSSNRTSRFTFEAEHENISPVWSPDGSRIAFGSTRGGKTGLYVKASDNTGDEVLLYETDSRFVVPYSWSPDGKMLLFGSGLRGASRDLWTIPVDGAGTAAPLWGTSFAESQGQISPDGRWLAYATNETGVVEVYVRPASGAGGKWAVSSGGGSAPRWRGDSRELYYVSSTHLMAVDVTSSGPAFVAAEPRALFAVPDLAFSGGHTVHFTYAAAADGQRFLMTLRGDGNGEAVPTMVVMLDWMNGSRR
jgi:Tol biopolymer transport system component